MTRSTTSVSYDERRLIGADGVRRALDQVVTDAARDGAILRPAEVVRKLSAEHPDAGVPRAQLAEAIVRAAAARGVSILVARPE